MAINSLLEDKEKAAKLADTVYDFVTKKPNLRNIIT